MKVKDTLDVDKIWFTLPDKMQNFTGRRSLTADARFYIEKNFPRWQYNGVADFDNILIWCEQHLGNNFLWNFETIYFKTERDKAFFLLKWQ